MDTTYLKNVILGGFESGELPASSQMLPVLGRLLQFSPAEMERIQKRPGASGGSGGGSGFKLPGFG